MQAQLPSAMQLDDGSISQSMHGRVIIYFLQLISFRSCAFGTQT
jgi:hypothetical protein